MADSIQSFRDLVAWQKAFQVGLEVYRVTRKFPRHEQYGLMSQLRRGAVSIASNIAEGYGRESTTDYLRFLRVARGALFELDTQLLFAVELGYIERTEHCELTRLLNEAGRVLAGLIRSVSNARAN